MTEASNVGVLDGVKVVELTMWIAGPSAAGLLCDWGADVIKVEPKGGDPQRNILGALGYGDLPVPGFALDNRGKRSVVLDLNADDDRDAMEQLLASADVYLTNMRPHSLAGIGLAPEQVHERHPHLVVTTITGYGLDGPEAWRPGYDIGAFWARTGIARDLVPRNAAPVGVRGGLGDHFTGMTAAAGTAAALVEKSRTGKGRIVEASLLRTGVWAIGHQVVVQDTFGKLESAKPRDIAPTPLVNPYETADGKWFWLIGVEADRHFPGVAKAIEREDLLSDERFGDAKTRRQNSAALIAEMDEAFRSQPMDHWSAKFDEFDVWWSPANTIAEVLEDPQIQASGAFVEVEADDGSTYRSVNSPVTFRGNPLTRTRHSPAVGEHTTEVLAEIGIERPADA
ncbi:MAG: CoA transferase [Acidimicrobiia bacterium]|nr:CoA transferase [Acidimicrobiia bacterium]